jgi:hypothetical protein
VERRSLAFPLACESRKYTRRMLALSGDAVGVEGGKRIGEQGTFDGLLMSSSLGGADLRLDRSTFWRTMTSGVAGLDEGRNQRNQMDRTLTPKPIEPMAVARTETKGPDGRE